jgi:uncharacterized membrane protein YfcA
MPGERFPIPTREEPMRILLYLLLGWGIGTVSGALGIGGGVLLVPALMWLCKMKYPEAAGTSLAVLVPPVGLLAAWKSWQEDRVDLEAAFWIALAFAGGAYFGAAILKYIPTEFLRLSFGFLMLYIAMRFILSSDNEAANAAAGLGTVAVGWVSYFFLRRLGRRHLPAPDLGSHIRTSAEQGRGESEYYI